MLMLRHYILSALLAVSSSAVVTNAQQNCTRLFSSSSSSHDENKINDTDTEQKYCIKDDPRYGCDEGKLCIKLYGETYHTCQGGNAKTSQETHCFDKTMLEFMETSGFPGASVAVLKNQGEVAYSQGYGIMDMGRNGRKFMPWTPSRIASISKTITVLAALRLVEQGKVDLQEKVFGGGDAQDGILNVSNVEDPRVFDITVEHLMRHQGGWDVGNFGGTGIPDPFFDLFYSGDIILNEDGTYCMSTFDSEEECGRTGEEWMVEIGEKLGKAGPFDRHDLIDYMVQHQPLAFSPGTATSYSNLGMSVLASVIEETVGKPYEAAVRELFLSQACVDEQQMYQGKTLRPSDTATTLEPQYYSDVGLVPSVFNFSELVPVPYSFFMEPKVAEGGMVASAQELLQMISYATEPFCASADKVDALGKRCLLNASSMEMAKTTTIADTFGREFGMGLVKGSFPGDFWNGGNLDGSQARLYMSGDWAWAFVSNRNADPGDEPFYNAFTSAIECVESWNASFPSLPQSSSEDDGGQPDEVEEDAEKGEESGDSTTSHAEHKNNYALTKITTACAAMIGLFLC